MNDVKQIVAKNIGSLRQSAHMTQLELAEKLNYSDKAVSKWERGDALPDIATLSEIAQIFGVTLDYLIQPEHPQPSPKAQQSDTPYNRPIILCLALLLVWFVAMLAFVVSSWLTDHEPRRYLAFLYAVPVSAVVWLTLNSVWFNRRVNYLIISLLMWSVLASIHLTCLAWGVEIHLIYLLGAPGQLMIFLWMFMKKQSRRVKGEKALDRQNAQ